MNKAYNRCLSTRLPLVHPEVRWIVGKSTCVNNIYSSGSDKLTKEQLHMSYNDNQAAEQSEQFITLKSVFHFLI